MNSIAQRNALDVGAGGYESAAMVNTTTRSIDAKSFQRMSNTDDASDYAKEHGERVDS